ncbi:helix-turn-helix domain-containing protein [Paenibacillus chondroitinus]|uniref:Helix-turn-helix domain-containing protein n=1 Tax=Paenibacillus chondroitinus TaxID=59842 RepID=A0ABU6DCK8_9BACL|nr:MULTISPECIES: helix-turn-helix domain-containing protein [Paenibacillus]MCY9662289.1 helix-turn-helix domain-containing protein [Paenibacillus anseongense]MEB4794673.1 helix-turn-helix domain-containing protein [Paenibacillus chondroitinus]
MPAIISKWKKLGFRSILFRLILLFLSITMFLQLINFLSYNVLLSKFENQIEHNYDRSVANIASSLNNLFEGIYQTNYLLALDPNVLRIFSANYTIDDVSKYADITEAIRSLSRIKSSSNYIDNAYIYKRSEKLIISDEGTYASDFYYDKVYRSGLYPKDFWKAYQANHHLFTILPPSDISRTIRNHGKTSIPVVQSMIGGYWSNDLYVINLDVQPIIQLLRSFKITPNSMLLVSNQDNQLLFSTEENNADMSAILEKAVGETANRFKMTFRNQEMLIIKFNTSFFFQQANMIVSVPITDIKTNFNNFSNWNIIVTAIALLVGLLMSILFTKMLYSPIRALVRTLQDGRSMQRSSDSFKEFEYINNEIDRMKSNVAHLNETLSYTLPLVIDQFLVKMLKSNSQMDHSRIDDFLANCKFSFMHDSFWVGLIQCNFKKPFYDSFSEEFQNQASQRLLKLMKSMIPPSSSVYLLEMDTNLFAILVNLPHDADTWAYHEYLQQIDDLFQTDKAFVHIHIGIGRKHTGYQGMQRSYVEAMKALWRVSPFDTKRISIYNENNQDESGYLLSKTDENKLLNLLLSNKQEDLQQLLKTIINANMNSAMTDMSSRQLYMHLYLIGTQALKQLDTTMDESIFKNYSEFVMSISTHSIGDMADFIVSFYDSVLEACTPVQPGFDIKLFKQYIDDYYHEDISLDMLADKYNTSPKYMSKLLKKELGMTFQRYLQELRIAKAKEMLQHTSKPIQKILEEIGFNNRNSFIRTFRNLEGISPTEYRIQRQVRKG